MRLGQNKAKVKAGERGDEKADDAAEAKATAACKKQQSENATQVAQDYKNFGPCVSGKAKARPTEAKVYVGSRRAAIVAPPPFGSTGGG